MNELAVTAPDAGSTRRRPSTSSIRWRALLLQGGAALALVMGCRPALTNVEQGSREQVLHRGIGVDPGTIDPQRNSGAPEAAIINALFDSLVYANPGNVNEVLPKGAERWEISADGLVYDFFLRRDARWSNGDPVVAEDYRAAILRLLEPALAGTLVDYAYPIAGAEDYHRGPRRDEAAVGVMAVAPHHLRIRLRAPMPHFVHFLEEYPFVAVHRRSIEAAGGWLNPASPWTRAGKMVTNGPFQLKRWIPGQELVVERNPHYWGGTRLTLHGLHFHPIDSIDAEERAFRVGQLHVTSMVPGSRIAHYRESGSPALRISERFGLHYLCLNTEKPPLSDPRVRRALALAINRRQLVERVLGAGERPALTFGQPGMGGYDPRQGLAENVDEARALLAAAGFAGGTGLPVLTYLYNTSERNREVAEALQQMWRRELGVTVRLVNQEWRVFLDTRRLGEYDIARAGWLPFTPEPAELFQLCHSTSISNDSNWGSPEYDALHARAATTIDRAARHRLYRELDRILLEQMPVVPVAYYSVVRLVDPGVQGWQDNPRDKQFLELLSLRGSAP